MNDLIARVPFVYGGHCYVSKHDLANERKTYLPLYTRDGRKYEDTPRGHAAMKRGEAMTLHRENIGPRVTEAQSLAMLEDMS